MRKPRYICETERDTWEVRNSFTHEVYAVIVRWLNQWEIQERLGDSLLRSQVRAEIWEFLNAETERRGESERPAYCWDAGRPEPLQKEKAQQKEELPVWLL